MTDELNRVEKRKWVIIEKLIDYAYNFKPAPYLIRAKKTARKIDNILRELYGNEQPNADEMFETAKKMIEKFEDVDEFIMNIEYFAGIQEYCVGCVNSEDCQTCEFAKRAGICDEPGSLYRDFIEWMDLAYSWRDD